MRHNQTLMRRRMRRERIIKRFIALSTYAILFLIICGLNNKNKELTTIIEDNIATHNAIISEKDKEIAELAYTVADLNEIIQTIDAQSKYVIQINRSHVDELNTLRKRAELYDKYEYAIIYEGERTDLTYEEIEYGEDLMIAKGYDPNLMFGTIMVESNAIPTAVNKSSGATGYGQFLDSTARWVWTKILGNSNSTYYSDIRKDGKTNILMMAEYYDYLYSEYDNTFKVMKHYSGNSTNEGASKYIAKVNNFIKKVGAVIK